MEEVRNSPLFPLARLRERGWGEGPNAAPVRWRGVRGEGTQPSKTSLEFGFSVHLSLQHFFESRSLPYCSFIVPFVRLAEHAADAVTGASSVAQPSRSGSSKPLDLRWLFVVRCAVYLAWFRRFDFSGRLRPIREIYSEDALQTWLRQHPQGRILVKVESASRGAPKPEFE